MPANDLETVLRQMAADARRAATRQSVGSRGPSTPVSVSTEAQGGPGSVPEMVLDDPSFGLYWPADPLDDWVHI